MSKQKSMGEILYGLLPELYRKEDAEREHLKRFLQVAGVGLDYLRDKTQGHASMFDLDKTPDKLLPYIAEMLGFIFPYDMSSEEQRNLLKVLPTLYKLKGNETSFDYLAKRIFGAEANTSTQWISRGGSNKENLIKINVDTGGELGDLTKKILRFETYADQFRPVNHKIQFTVPSYTTDVWDRQSRTLDILLPEVFKSSDTEIYDKTVKITEIAGTELLRDFVNEVYNKSGMIDDVPTATIKYSAEDDSYNKPWSGALGKTTADTHTDTGRDFSGLIGIGKLNTTLKTNKPITIINY